MNAGFFTLKVLTRWALGVSAIAVLGACSGSGSVNVGSGQSPDPATVDFPIFYVKRSIPMDTDDVTQLRDAVPDADLFKRDRASPSAPETNISERITGPTDLYDIKNLNVSYDGTKLLFAMRGPLEENMDEEDPPTWNIWEYDNGTDTLRRVISSDITAEEGNDIAPAYLPDGRIVFSSTRQRQSKAILLDESKPQFEAQNETGDEPAFVLHVMNADGSGIKQISFNQSHDLDPTVLVNGRVLWSRWDRAPGNDGIHLYTANPDGSRLELHYGANSHNTGTDNENIEFLNVREMQNGNLLALVRERSDVDFGGDLIVIDATTYVENTQPTLANEGLPGPAQGRATANDVRTIPGPSPGGRYRSGFPLWDGTERILVTWSQCRVLDNEVDPPTIVPCTSERLSDPLVEVAPVLYSVWMFDPGQNTLQPVMTPEEGVMYSEVVAAQSRRVPGVILDRVPGVDFDADLVAQAVGILDIKSVYDFDGVDTATPNLAAVTDPAQTTAAQRPARFLRIEKAVSQADDDVRDIDGAAFGATNFMREIIGYAPIEPDGSVRVKVPADVAFQLSILDSNGRRISPEHNNWLQVRTGEVLSCNGCHTPATTESPRSHGRFGLSVAVNRGAASTGVPFANTNASLSPQAGESMAQTRGRISCESDTPRCAVLSPSVNLQYTDVWTDPVAAGRAADPDITYSYVDASFTTPAPTSDDCRTTWDAKCRIIINYIQHIQPLWDKPRQILDPNNGNVLADNTCSQAGCHNVRDAADMPQVPGGQLDLTAVPSDEEALQLRSYRELLFTDNEQEVNMGALQDRLVPGPPDANGNPTQVTVPVGPYVNARSARGALSGQFLSRFEPASGSTHAGFLSAAELRLLSEWLDIGAQYFNNPFDPAVPLN
jgi:hypothetical protein